MFPRKCEAENTTNTLISLVEIKYLQSDSLALMPEAESRQVSNEEIDPESLEDELTPGTLAILARIETFDEYFHCCGRW
ncbi:MAG TPA: hypothetical protein DDW76_14825 [Cyanobacteria bacterium UBA11369]|nr:hypothetical protein [Cyanobacteria bacterium UBA11371]HBE16316.1 hypothetical protein [Cyanobacteria bacterium UBA11367]HBE36099.1 hypothetical protein [Cyanobacteria bacterium UBA11368]HBE50031.1 hypothetical protein [Cyanobacteria bacterium UBA11369]